MGGGVELVVPVVAPGFPVVPVQLVMPVSALELEQPLPVSPLELVVVELVVVVVVVVLVGMAGVLELVVVVPVSPSEPV